MMKSVLTHILVLLSIFKLEPLKGCFQILISLRSPEPLCFNHWFHSLCHGLSHWSDMMLWKSNFISSIWHVSKAHHYFWDGGQARFHALSSSRHSTYSRWDSYQALMVASQWVRCRPAARSILEPHDSREWRSGLVETGFFLWDKAFFQRAPLCFAKCACTGSHPGDTLYDRAFESLRGRSSRNSEQTHDHWV